MVIVQQKYLWTRHAQVKMRQYRLSESRVRRIIRRPERIEEGIAPNTIAAMQRAISRRRQELWVRPRGARQLLVAHPAERAFRSRGATGTHRLPPRRPELWVMYQLFRSRRQIKIITAWRYPGVSPKRNPVPEEILREVRALL